MSSFSSFSRVVKLCLRVGLGLLLAGAAAAVRAATLATPEGFDPTADNTIYAMVVQPDGKILIGGAFTSIKPFNRGTAYGRARIARLNADGTMDESFDPSFNGEVDAIALQSDGKIVVGGKFTTVAPSGSTTTTSRTGLARLNADGSLDTTFDPHPQGGMTGEIPVSAIAVQSDGKIVIGGAFTSLQPNGASTATARQRLARLLPNGTLDTTFDPSANNLVYALALQPDGRILVGGGFTQLSPNGVAVSRSRVARLNVDGTVDSSFNVAADNRVLAIAVHPSGAIFLGGNFQTIQGTNDSATTVRSFLARVSASGAIDTTFDAMPSASVSCIAFSSDGKVLIGGSFLVVRPTGSASTVTRHYLARLTYEGDVDAGFDVTPTAPVNTIALQSDDRVLIGGAFTHVRGSGSSVSYTRYRAARLQADGTLDTGFSLNTAGTIVTMLRQSDGKIIVAGNFSTIAGVTRRNLARISADGTLDSDFHPAINGQISAAVLQSDGKLVIAGEFTVIDTVSRLHLARLNADGSLDATYDPKANGSIYSMLLQSDGKVIVGGGFTTFTPNGASSSTSVTYLARINSDGTVDTTYSPTPNNVVYGMALQSDGRAVVTGAFTTFAPNSASTSTSRYYLARVETNGTIDSNFSPSLNDYGYTVSVADSKIVVGGRFTAVANSKSTTSVTRSYIARFDSAGNVDTTFNPSANGVVYAILPLSDGYLIGGAFTTLQPNSATSYTDAGRIGRLKADGSLSGVATPYFDGEVHSLLALADNSFLVGGLFASYTTADNTRVAAESHLAHLTSTGTPDTAFRVSSPNSTAGNISAIALQQDGQMLVGGTFTGFGGGSTTNLARLTANGDVDSSFTTSANGTVSALSVQPTPTTEATQANLVGWLESNGHYRTSFSLSALQSLSGYILTSAVQSDGKLLVGGNFTNSAGTPAGYLLRFNADGSIDTSFNPAVNGSVRAIALLANGDMLVGGAFTSVGGVTRNYLAKVKADGSLDTSFDPNASALVNTICVQSDGKILIGGSFTSLQPNGATSTTARAYLARLNADGSIDTGFYPTPNAAVTAIAVDGGKIIAGGAFTTVQPNGASSATTRNYLARFNSDGTLDTSWNPSPNASVASIVRLSDSRVVIGGAFTTLQPNSATTTTTRYYLARLNEDGTVDAGFSPQFNSEIVRVAVGSGDSIYVAGSFTVVYSPDFTSSVARNRLAHFSVDGTLDLNFNPNASNTAYSIESAPDGSVIVAGAFSKLGADATVILAGSFTQVGGATVPYLARLTTDGNPDTAFGPQPNGAVRALAVHTDGRFYAAGEFTQISGAARGHLARFTRDGSLDAAFAPSADGAVRAVVLQPDGRLVIAGDFGTVNGTPRVRLARLNADGSLDSTFNPGADGAISALLALGNGQLLVGGEFANIGGGARARLARLNADGSLDAGFNAAPDGAVRTLALQASGKIYVGGEFQNIAGHAQARLARLNADGSFDSAVAPTVDGTVETVVLRDDGRAFFGGAFTTLDGTPSYLLGRLPILEQAVQRLTVTGNRTVLSWSRSGSSPSFSTVLFSYSTNGSTWTDLGEGTHSAFSEVWQWTGSALPDATIYYIRAIGVEPSSRNSSSGVVQAVWQFYGSSGVGPNGTAASGSSGSGSSDPGSSGSSGSNTGGSGTDGSSSGGSGGSGSTGGTTTTGSGLVNLSTRVQITAGETVITGFVLNGTDSKRVLLRAVGPGLTAYGVANPVSKPKLELYNASGQLLLSGAQWQTDASLAAAFASSGAFALPTGSADSVAVATLAPGAYTVHVKNSDGTAGVLLTEVYEVDRDSDVAHFMNLSARATSSTGENIIIGGFIVQGSSAHAVVVRGLGPALQQYGLTGTLPNPVLRVYDSTGALIAENDDWSGTDVTTVTSRFGATALAAGSHDAAVVLNLAPGAYTATVADSAGSTGIGMIEVFDAQ